jgi:hypothetical protein
MPVPPGLVVKTINVEDMRIITTLKNYLFYYIFDDKLHGHYPSSDDD